MATGGREGRRSQCTCVSRGWLSGWSADPAGAGSSLGWSRLPPAGEGGPLPPPMVTDRPQAAPVPSWPPYWAQAPALSGCRRCCLLGRCRHGRRRRERRDVDVVLRVRHRKVWARAPRPRSRGSPAFDCNVTFNGGMTLTSTQGLPPPAGGGSPQPPGFMSPPPSCMSPLPAACHPSWLYATPPGCMHPLLAVCHPSWLHATPPGCMPPPRCTKL